MRASWPTKSKEQEQEQGFSLPEMLIALALMGMLGYFTTKFVSSEQSKSEQSIRFSEIVEPLLEPQEEMTAYLLNTPIG